MASTFLRAEWRKLIMVNYIVDPAFISPFIPYGTEPDYWNGHCYISLVGFMFKNTRVRGVKVPYHVNFEEVNLRFYVRYNDQGTWKRGVVFIREIVPRRALSLVANFVYNEPYETRPMQHHWEETNDQLKVEYQWRKHDRWHSFQVEATNELVEIEVGSEAEFITEHFWGYTKMSEKRTSEYEVEHPRWLLYPVRSHRIDVDFESVYGAPFAFLNTLEPHSVFLAEGSEITVKKGSRI